MSSLSQYLINKPVIELDSIDSTNNYAMLLVDADKAEDGMTITATMQTAGKGQRGRQWIANAGESLLMSVIVKPVWPLEQQFLLCAAAALSVAEAVESFIDQAAYIKWTNDVFVGDKKAGGILIENVLRGNRWNYAVIGIGLNLLQSDFPAELPHATSIKKASGRTLNLTEVRDEIRMRLFKRLADRPDALRLINDYNGLLFRKDALQRFSNENGEWIARVVGATSEGKLEVINEAGETAFYTHGVQNWVL
ncbi:MAG TPA: biotin--[acetyl-CoA-carboxylase] ligase [Flavipsychrobacter sp.]|nr:biotin--[acetyl-CoA-carboxylase] ligase [Flavipsychrobacter sp.]